MPYWTTDIGGFIIGNPDDPGYRELFIRWFQYGAFCPIFRVHGTRTTNQNELWSYGEQAQQILVSFDKLRYRLMPYIYSVAWMTTHDHYTPMRPLIMDFAGDRQAMDVGDQFLFGPAILVNPVTDPGAISRRLYLPKARWYDFWSGAPVEGGRAIEAEAPLERMPLYVRAGSILPLGPAIEYTGEKPADPIELRVYRGADGHFTLYEDEGDTYHYEQGQYATIAFDWNEAARSLTIGPRQGSFPGMLAARTFHVVFVGGPEKTAHYSGQAVTVSAQP
jgi:alpha-D-xyloside xylohydrolase